MSVAASIATRQAAPAATIDRLRDTDMDRSLSGPSTPTHADGFQA